MKIDGGAQQVILHENDPYGLVGNLAKIPETGRKQAQAENIVEIVIEDPCA